MRFPGATWIPSPNFGYPRGTHGQLASNIQKANKSGEFWHSQQGRQAVAIRMFQNPATEISAHFLFPKVGKPVQMVDSSDPVWHTGNYLANLHFHGFEFEGGPPGNLSEPLMANQIAWGVKVTHWLRGVHGTPSVYVRRDTLWEHNEVKNTACPSGRIPWAGVITALEEDDDMLKFIKRASVGTVFATDGIYKWGIPSMAMLRELKAKGLATGDIQTVSDGLYNRIKHVPGPPLTAPQTQTEVKKAINAYGGKFRQWCREAIVSTGINIPNVHKSILAAIGKIEAGEGLSFDETKRAVKEAGKEGTG